MSGPAAAHDPRTAARLTERLAELATISTPGPGVSRLAFGPLERAAHERVAGWGSKDGARVEVDAAGNTVMVYAEGEPYLLIGSHLDSVPAGGRYDGAAGVVAALEVARAVAPELGLGLRVVAFSAEEGARFGRPCLGSELATGASPDGLLDVLRDTDGRTAIEVARESGLDPTGCVAWAAEPAVAAFVELHIEQGRVLEREGVRLGVVDVVAGATRLAVELTGRPEHSGTTPMDGRLDALTAMAEVVLAVEATGRATRHGVATVGHLEVVPNSATTVPGAVRAVVDVRDIDAGRQATAVADVRAAIAAIAAARGIGATIAVLADRPPVMLSAWARRALAEACTARGLPFRVLPSGAGHDAAVLALTAPAAILFVPTPQGRSHSPDEQCDVVDLAVACEVMALALRRLDATARGLAAEET
ncbi:MAG: Zn-dependent hydrolase [Solirubrobacterales bacterium]|nr:Zn-dependent hydrolase [Solirubrobacterales bacterium]